MAAQGGGNPGRGGGYAGAPQGGRTFERGGPSGVANGRGNGGGGGHPYAPAFGGQGRGGYGPQNQQWHQGRGYAGAPGGVNNGMQWNSGMAWQHHGYGRGYDNDPAVFGGDFGAFDEGYFDGDQVGQGFDNNAQAGQRNHRQRQAGTGGRGRAGRQGRGRFGSRGRGGRGGVVAPPREAPIAPQVHQQMVAAVAALPTQPPVLNIGAAPVPPAAQAAPALAAQLAPNQGDNRAEQPKQGVGQKPRKKDKILCFRCSQTGHYADDCTTILCLYCRKASHVSMECPLLSAPKPVATMYGLAHDSLLFFDVVRSDGVRIKNDSGKVGRIRIIGGAMTAQELVHELQWLVPGDHTWDIRPLENNSFRVVYPTKADLTRVRKIGLIHIEGRQTTINFEDFSKIGVNSYEFVDVWVRITGCPEDLRNDYLALFAVGSLIGKTKEVDMEFTRARGIVRLRASVTDPAAIPARTDYSYEGVGFFIDIEVEGDADAHMEDADPSDGHNDEEKKDDDETPAGSDKPTDEHPTTQPRAADSGSGSMAANGTNVQGGVVPREVLSFGSFEWDPATLVNTKNIFPASKGVSVPRRLWSDMVEEEEAFELARSAPPALVNKVSSQPAGVVKRLFHAAAVPPSSSPTSTPCSPVSNSIPAHATTPPVLSEACAISPSSHVYVSDVSAAAAVSVYASQNIAPVLSAGLEGFPQPGVAVTPMLQRAGLQGGMVDHMESGEQKAPTSPTVSSLAAILCPGAVISTPASTDSPRTPRGVSSSTPKSSSPKTQGGGKGSSYPLEIRSPHGTGVFLGGRYSKSDVISFGGIPEAMAVGVRSSDRVRTQPNADETSLARAQQRALARDADFGSGNSFSRTLDSYVVLSPAGGAPPGHGFWVQTFGDGCTGVIQPIRLAA